MIAFSYKKRSEGSRVKTAAKHCFYIISFYSVSFCLKQPLDLLCQTLSILTSPSLSSSNTHWQRTSLLLQVGENFYLPFNRRTIETLSVVTNLILIKHVENKGGKLCWVSKRKELLINLLKADGIQLTTWAIFDEAFVPEKQSIERND